MHAFVCIFGRLPPVHFASTHVPLVIFMVASFPGPKRRRRKGLVSAVRACVNRGGIPPPPHTMLVTPESILNVTLSVDLCALPDNSIHANQVYLELAGTRFIPAALW